MKRLFLLFAVVTAAACCRERLFDNAAPQGDGAPIYPLRLKSGVQHVFLTDYLPQWDGADSVTSVGAVLSNAAADWSEFDIEGRGCPSVSTLEVWRDGRCVSVTVLEGRRDDSKNMFTTGLESGMITVAADGEPVEIEAMWQNCRLPESSVVRCNGGFAVAVPHDAASLERSFIRVYAAGEEGLYNDILIPLKYGRAVADARELNRHDAHTQVLYSLMIDRFANGNPDNDRPLNREDVLPKVDYYGGDLKGITDKINEGFFNELGISTVWISPVTQNPFDAWGLNADPFTRFSGYHGYWPIYLTQIDTRFGTDAELRELLDAAHARDLNVVLDYVANHMHIDSPVLKAHPDWTTSMYLPDGRRNLELWDEQRLTTWFDVHIPTLDLERDEICEPLTDSALYWIAEYDFDGFRHDACKHIPENYWRMLCRKMKRRFPDRALWQIGETYGSPELIGSYVKTGMIDAQFDFNFYHTAIDVLASNGDMSEIARTVAESAANYGSHHTMGNITGNHDKPRFISVAGGAVDPSEDTKLAGWRREIGVGDPVGYSKLALLEAMICTIPGVPCFYQGDEYGVPGANDPDNRRMMAFDGYNDDEKALRGKVKALTALRRSSMPLLYGDMVPLASDRDVWVFARVYMGKCVVAAFNNSPESRTVEIRVPDSLRISPPAHLHFAGSETLESDGTLRIGLDGNSFNIIEFN
ncbi:MAG: hypothetical protein J1E04_00045 [Alistipes sp.]|nr:hypothetical protein [Alistipes sp.]